MIEGLTKLFIYGIILVWLAPILIIAGAGLLVIVEGVIKCIKK